MNKFFKRLALLLAVLMIVSMMPVQLFADNSVTGEEQSNGTGEASGNSNAVATVNGVGYATLAEAIAAANGNGTVTLLTATTELVQALLDGQYGSINGKTIILPSGNYDQLDLGRATKYAGSDTAYMVGGYDDSAANYKKFDTAEELIAYKNGNAWTPNCYYIRTVKDVTIKAAEGADVKIGGMKATSGFIYGVEGAPAYDYVLDISIPDNNKGYYLAYSWNNITFEGLTFTAKVNINSSLEQTAISCVAFKNCKFRINDNTANNPALRYYNENNNGKLSDLRVIGCDFDTCYQGVYTSHIKNITVTGSTFTNTAHNAIAIQNNSDKGACNHGDVVISGNYFENVGDRIIRFNNAGEDTTITITDNTSVNSGNSAGEIIKATTMPDSVKINMTSNTWGDVNGKTAVIGNGFNKVVVATVNGVGYASLAEAIANATPDANGVITYEISGKAEISGADQWISFVKNAEGVTAVKFVGMTADAEISITSSGSILGVQGVDVDVSFENLTLSHPNGIWVNDLGHATKYFTCMVRRDGHTVTYTNCTFPNGACNNQYGKTVFDGCKFTNKTSGKYNLWNYGGETVVKDSAFTGTRGIKTYNEGAASQTIEIVKTTFNGITEKAAIVSSKPTSITLTGVSVTGCEKGLLQKDLGTGVTIEVNGSNISGTFDVTADKTAAEGFNISGGTFTSEVSSDYLADGFEVKNNGDGTYGVSAKSYVATIGTVGYETLDDAIKAAQNGEVIVVNAGEYKLNGSLTYTGKAFTIKAADGAKVSFDMSAAVALHGAKITFEGVTFDYKTNGNYIGLQHADTLVYNKCTINGMVFLYATNETFNGCTFNQTSADAYNVWTYGAKNVKFNGCVFNCVGKSVLLYNENKDHSTNLTVADTTFTASEPVAGKAAIEIDTSLMSGANVTVDKATADKTTGFAKGSNSGNSLWNDKKQTAETNKNTTVIVNGETVFEPAIIDLDTFIKKLVASDYSFDGTLKNGGKLTVKWSPVSGCYDTRAGHTCTVNGVTATGNTPKRVNSGLTQFQLFEGSDVAVTIKNVKFVYEPADFTVCENSGWKESFTAEQAPAGQLYFMTTGDVTVDSCDFEKVVFTTFNTTGTTTVNACTFKDVYNNYAIKDIRGENVSVTGTTIENCGGGIMVSSTGDVSNVTITGNTFKNVDAAGTAAADKVGTRAILQIASFGDYASTAFDFSGNTATSCGPVIRQLNASAIDNIAGHKDTLTELVGDGKASGYATTDSEVSGYIKDENGNVTISTAEGLFWFAKQVNSGNNFAGKTVKLANDIDLNNELWTPIGIYDDSKTHFKGTFDGQNHIVSGLNVVESRKNGVGFFGKVYTGTIKNLTVEGNITSNNCNYVGGIVGHGYATITNCTFRGNVGSNTTMQVGGIAGSGGFTVTNCSVYGNVTAECWAGGIVGNCQDGGAYTNCYVEGKISAERTYWGGGAAGITPVPLYPSQVISGCYSNTVVKVAGAEVNCPIIAAYNNPLDYNGYTGDLKIYDNSWNKQKNSNDSYPIYAEKNGEGGVLAEGKTVSRDNNLIMLEDDLKYVEGDLSAVRIMAGSAVTQEQVDALAVAQLGDRKYTSLDTAIAAANAGDTVKLLADVTADVVINKNITLDLGGKTLTNTGAGKATISIANGATATVKNGNVIGGASYYNIGVGTEVNSTANLTLEDVTATAGNTGSSMIDNWGTLTIKSGTYTGGLNVVKSEEGSTLTINGGKFELNYAVSNNYNGVILSAGTTMITGGEFIQNATTPQWGYPQVVLAMQVDGYTSKIEITGGTFTNKKSGSNIFHGYGKATSDNFEVSGGTFNKSVSQSYFTKGYECVKKADGTYGVQEATKGSKNYPYTLAELSVMTRDEYIAAQKALGGTMYVEIGDYSYDKNGVLGNGVRNDTPGQTEDLSVLNGYNSNGYLGEKNDGANGKNIIFVGGSVTSGVTGYASIDNIGTSLLLAVPAYTNVTFEGTTFNNVMSFDYQLYTGPWSQLGKLKFDNCKFNGLIVGAIASQTLTFNKCTFTNYINTISANNSNPTWIRPAYGNWSKGDNEGQGSDFKSLTTINFTNNTVTSTRPVKFERIAQWEMDTKVTVTGNEFDIKSDGSSKNVGLYFGANAKFDLVVDNNKKTDGTAALYTAVYKAPNGTDYAGLPAGSTVKDSNGADVEVAGVIWKTTDALTLKTTTEAVEVAGVKFATLEEAYAAAKNGDTITLLADVELSSAIEIQKGKTITLDLNGKKLSTDLQPGGTKHYYAIDNYGTFTLRDSSAEQSGEIRARGIENLETGTMTIESGKIVAIDTNGGAAIWNNANLTINGGTFVAEHVGASSDQFGPGCVYNDGTLTINGGTFMSANKRTYAIVSKAGTVTITPADGKNVTISGAHGGLGIDGGTAIINGGSYASDDYYGLYVSNDAGTADVTVNGGTFTGNKYSVLIGSDGSSSVTSTLKINGGTFDMPIHAQENTTDGAIVISGGKFKFKVDDKYFKDGFACSTDTTGGYYTVKGHPITNMGLSIGEGLSLRIYLLDGTTTGKLRVTYTKPDGEEVSYIIDETEFELVGNEENGYTEKYFFRIFNITPQMADMTITVQYIGEDGKDFGSAKEVSILKYCEGYIAKYPTENVKTFVSKLLEYCASAMDYVAIKYSEQVYNGKTWTERATALRAEKERLCGTDVPTFDFKELGTNSKFGRKIFDTNGIIFGESLTFYLGIRKENYNPDYHYIPTGSNETKPVFDEKSGEYRFYFTMAPYEYNTSMRIVVKSGNSTICERATSLDFLLNKYSDGDSATARFCKAAYEYCRALEAVIKDINK